MSLSSGSANGHHEKEPIVGICNLGESDPSSFMANYNKSHKPGISNEEVIKSYSEWADNYEKDISLGCYNGPQMAGHALAKIFDKSERGTVRVLDVAAGTGCVGNELILHGFRHIDALEPSPEMLKILKDRNIYSECYQTPIGSKCSHDITKPKAYDALVIAGAMGEGHIPVDGINEMIRLVKSGGKIVIVMREEYLNYVLEYVDKLEPYMQELEKNGYWKQLSREIVPEYSCNKNGVIYTYEVTSSEFPA